MKRRTKRFPGETSRLSLCWGVLDPFIASGRGVNGHDNSGGTGDTAQDEPGNGVRGRARLADASWVEQPELGRWRALRSPEAAPDGGADG
ncbi:MAG TPA: hypothetical protein VKF14_15200 [Candidatus Dormibacteraeota bacterium]|nr:hypothetical protein [Candidatus Dormibacteraeota bacterium]